MYLRPCRICLMLLLALPVSANVFAADCVVLLHGLARTASSMDQIETHLTQAGFRVVNVDYPSRQHPVETLSQQAVGTGVEQCRQQASASDRIHFVTHSLGGILVRYYVSQSPLPELGRVVMLGPPNQGSEVVDTLRDVPGFKWFHGPAGSQLGTEAESFVRRLGPVNFPLGVIAGTRSINLILSTFLPNPDDGKVSVIRTRVKGMCELLVLPVTHAMMMRNRTVMAEVLHFIRHGRFASRQAERVRNCGES